MFDLNIGDRCKDAIDWLVENFSGFFDFVYDVLIRLLAWTYDLLAALKPGPMIIVLALIALIATRKISVTVVLAVGLVVVDSMDLWFATMQTMTMVLVSTVIALLIGIPLGIWAAFSTPVRAVVTPLLDLMQTIPVFVYLLPSILFFGIGAVPGVVATIIFAMPPAVRLTQLGIRQVDAETVEASVSFGAGRWEVLREVQLPLAKPSIMAGVNQVIMLALSMVVVAGLVGADGLGKIVVEAVQSLQIPASIEGGLAVVILAIYLDRVSAGFGGQGRGNPSWWPKKSSTAGVELAQADDRTQEKELVAVG